MRNPHPTFIEDGDQAPGQEEIVRKRAEQPTAEDELGGGDICSVEETPSTDDDKPLD